MSEARDPTSIGAALISLRRLISHSFSGRVSLLRRTIYFPEAFFIPSFTALEKPQFFLNVMIRPPGYLLWIYGTEPSLDPLSTTIISKSCTVWSFRAARHPGSQFMPFQFGMMIDALYGKEVISVPKHTPHSVHNRHPVCCRFVIEAQNHSPDVLVHAPKYPEWLKDPSDI